MQGKTGIAKLLCKKEQVDRALRLKQITTSNAMRAYAGIVANISLFDRKGIAVLVGSDYTDGIGGPAGATALLE